MTFEINYASCGADGESSTKSSFNLIILLRYNCLPSRKSFRVGGKYLAKESYNGGFSLDLLEVSHSGEDPQLTPR